MFCAPAKIIGWGVFFFFGGVVWPGIPTVLSSGLRLFSVVGHCDTGISPGIELLMTKSLLGEYG